MRPKLNEPHARLTVAGLTKFKKELRALKKRWRQQEEWLKDEFKADNEDASFTTRMIEQQQTQGRIQALERTVRTARPMTETDHAETAGIGCKIQLTKPDGSTCEFMLVESVEADPLDGRISIVSPLGLAADGKKVGDKIAVEAPCGKICGVISKLY